MTLKGIWNKGSRQVSLNKEGGMLAGHGTVQDAWSSSTNDSKTYSNPMRAVAVSNDGTTDLTLTIGAITVTIKSAEQFEAAFDAFTSLTITTTSAHRVVVMG